MTGWSYMTTFLNGPEKTANALTKDWRVRNNTRCW